MIRLRKNQSSLHVLYVKVKMLFGIAPYSKRKTLRNERNMYPNKNFALRVHRAITVFVIVARPESAPSQIVKARTTCSYMERRKFFLLRILKVPRRQVTQTLNMYQLTLPSAIFIARSQLKASCQLHHSLYLRMRRLLMPLPFAIVLPRTHGCPPIS